MLVAIVLLTAFRVYQYSKMEAILSKNEQQ
jgi:hypothetical protein